MLKVDVTQGVTIEGGGGILGMTIARNETSGSKYVFVYYTEASNSTSSNRDAMTSYDPLANRLYRYELVDNKLTNPTLFLSLPALPGPTHGGGVMTIGRDENIYLAVGDLQASVGTGTQTQAENNGNSSRPDGRSGILYVDHNGKTVLGIIGDRHPLDKYYAYGIRNSFGIDFDSVTSTLWDTENGPSSGDEINLVEPGFNSGWERVSGIWEPIGYLPGSVTLNPDNLVDFDRRGRYSSPEFMWRFVVAPTDLEFYNSDKLGEKYRNDLFVADYNYGNKYNLDLHENRTSLMLSVNLEDKIADTPREFEPLIFTHGFGPISSLEESPDGYLHFAVYLGGGQGSVFNIPLKDELNPLNIGRRFYCVCSKR